ncbi:abortive infection system antitoxin AbiGi family protein [Caenimonas soli]|uniref:abortive infection system antitoxin AbiGi family protein n=1 Tax=Caenimonas soli TaxID=2735555 RepID=UPI0015537F0E|nr:abortive infection system antitoxin AbiGi family protein [Caenimonas soli]NPC59388.1 hypothetical protein [Caenimonas soli]
MKSPYPQILFHFAEEPEALEGVLKEGAFLLSYARERIENAGPDKEFGVPMVSFCDLRLSELPFHMDKYGQFGIGLSKEWALRSGLNPVAYVNKSSHFTNRLLGAIQELWNECDSITDDFDELLRCQERYMNVINTLRYIKNYEGTLDRRGSTSQYRFADEREWRYVPDHPTQGVLPFLPTALMSKKAFYKEQLRPYKLAYSPSDVKYLLVQTEANVPQLRQIIDGLPVRDGDRNHLLTRIITAEQVASDF